MSVLCLLVGHDDRIVRAPDRLRLRCDRCHRETPGWTLASEAGDPRDRASLEDLPARVLAQRQPT